MQKFKVLKYNESFMTRLGVQPYRLTEDSNEFFSASFPYYILLVALCSAISCAMFVNANWPHLEIVSQSCIVFIGMFQTGGMFCCLGLHIKKVKSIHHQLETIIGELGM